MVVQKQLRQWYFHNNNSTDLFCISRPLTLPPIFALCVPREQILLIFLCFSLTLPTEKYGQVGTLMMAQTSDDAPAKRSATNKVFLLLSASSFYWGSAFQQILVITLQSRFESLC